MNLVQFSSERSFATRDIFLKVISELFIGKSEKMEIKNCGKNKVSINGKCVGVIIIPLKDLNEGLADARREIKEYQNPEDMDIAQGYGYREGTIDALNWIKNFKM